MDGKNKLYFGDNLKILREYVPEASVDLIYLDPPFNSSATYTGAPALSPSGSRNTVLGKNQRRLVRLSNGLSKSA